MEPGLSGCLWHLGQGSEYCRNPSCHSSPAMLRGPGDLPTRPSQSTREGHLHPRTKANLAKSLVGRLFSARVYENSLLPQARERFQAVKGWLSFLAEDTTSPIYISLKHLIYNQCNVELGTHERVDLDSNGTADLQLLFNAYKQWRRVPDHNAEDWADWIHQGLNGSSHNVLQDGTYSLELVLDWSATRIATVVLFPILLSLAVGIWINAEDWTDLATLQTAWGTASYVVTAGGRKFSPGPRRQDGGRPWGQVGKLTE